MAIDEGDLFGSAVDIALALFPAWVRAREELDVSQCTDGITNKRMRKRGSVLGRCCADMMMMMTHATLSQSSRSETLTTARYSYAATVMEQTPL